VKLHAWKNATRVPTAQLCNRENKETVEPRTRERCCDLRTYNFPTFFFLSPYKISYMIRRRNTSRLCVTSHTYLDFHQLARDQHAQQLGARHQARALTEQGFVYITRA
jgi:hypothetical protein